MRYIVVHSPSPVIAFGVTTTAHAFGPYETWEEAEAAHNNNDDDCFKWALPVVGPDQRDIDASEEEERLALDEHLRGLGANN